jgi:hypothetical protein
MIISDGITTEITPFVNGNPATQIIDATTFAGQTVNISIHSYGEGLYDQWGLTNFMVWGTAQGTSIPYNSYYPSVDEKVIFEFDLTKAFTAIMSFDTNFSMNDGDIGYLQISTDGGSTWTTIKEYTGTNGGWLTETFDITDYAAGDVPVLIRCRFVSDATPDATYFGWMVDNFKIGGKVDFTAPTASHTISPAAPNGNNGWYTSDVTITLNAEDNIKVDKIYYRIDGGSWLTYTSPITIGIEGEHTIEYYAVDTVGNVGTIGTVSFKIDKTAPTASINVPQAGYIYFFGRELMPRIIFKDKALIIGGLVAEATGSDATSGLYVLKFNEDGTTFAEDTTSPFQAPLPFSMFGSHELTVTAVDFAGNTYTTSAVPYFKIF